MIIIREAIPRDHADIQSIYLTTFGEDEKAQVAMLAIDLLNEESQPETFALVAEADKLLVGHVGLSPVALDHLSGLSGYILAPLAVKPAVQKRGVGSKLIEAAVRRLKVQGVNILFVYGDPKYYERFGFTTDTAQPFKTPYKLQFPNGWMARVLNDTVGLNQQAGKISCVEPLNDSALW